MIYEDARVVVIVVRAMCDGVSAARVLSVCEEYTVAWRTQLAHFCINFIDECARG